MVKRKLHYFLAFFFVFVIISAIVGVSPAHAQTYRFSLSDYQVEAYIQADGSLTLTYIMTFENDPGADPIDYVDVGLPQANYSASNANADVDGVKINHIANSSYVSGLELGLGNKAIQPGKSGVVRFTITDVKPVLYPYDNGDKEDYANFQFRPNTFGSQYDNSTDTKYRMTIILPPGVGADQGIYYNPKYWPGDSVPQEASQTQDGRVYYSWYTENADAHSKYEFGVAFPAAVVPADAIATKEIYTNLPSGGGSTSSSSWSTILHSLPCCLGITGFIALLIYVSVKSQKAAQKRRLSYMPPKISMEGHGIKRGLTAVEAAILMEEPMTKILTMILFGLIKKGVATVTQQNPLRISTIDPLPQGLYPYELGFISSAQATVISTRESRMKSTMIDLVKSVTEKMKGFSKKETVEYYTDIMNRAWKSVEDSQTPEVKSEQFERVLEWTMLGEDSNERTKRTFDQTVVILPNWWGRYDPSYRPAHVPTTPRPTTTGGTVSSAPAPSGAGKGLNMPGLPGSDFAASLLTGMQTTAAGLVGNVTGFQSSITNATNPVPVSSSSSGSGGWRGGGGGGGHSSCACACACAGCACACAGGGR